MARHLTHYLAGLPPYSGAPLVDKERARQAAEDAMRQGGSSIDGSLPIDADEIERDYYYGGRRFDSSRLGNSASLASGGDLGTNVAAPAAKKGKPGGAASEKETFKLDPWEFFKRIEQQGGADALFDDERDQCDVQGVGLAYKRKSETNKAVRTHIATSAFTDASYGDNPRRPGTVLIDMAVWMDAAVNGAMTHMDKGEVARITGMWFYNRLCAYLMSLFTTGATTVVVCADIGPLTARGKGPTSLNRKSEREKALNRKDFSSGGSGGGGTSSSTLKGEAWIAVRTKKERLAKAEEAKARYHSIMNIDPADSELGQRRAAFDTATTRAQANLMLQEHRRYSSQRSMDEILNESVADPDNKPITLDVLKTVWQHKSIARHSILDFLIAQLRYSPPTQRSDSVFKMPDGSRLIIMGHQMDLPLAEGLFKGDQYNPRPLPHLFDPFLETGDHEGLTRVLALTPICLFPGTTSRASLLPLYYSVNAKAAAQLHQPSRAVIQAYSVKGWQGPGLTQRLQADYADALKDGSNIDRHLNVALLPLMYNTNGEADQSVYFAVHRLFKLGMGKHFEIINDDMDIRWLGCMYLLNKFVRKYKLDEPQIYNNMIKPILKQKLTADVCHINKYYAAIDAWIKRLTPSDGLSDARQETIEAFEKTRRDADAYIRRTQPHLLEKGREHELFVTVTQYLHDQVRAVFGGGSGVGAQSSRQVGSGSSSSDNGPAPTAKSAPATPAKQRPVSSTTKAINRAAQTGVRAGANAGYTGMRPVHFMSSDRETDRSFESVDRQWQKRDSDLDIPRPSGGVSALSLYSTDGDDDNDVPMCSTDADADTEANGGEPSDAPPVGDSYGAGNNLPDWAQVVALMMLCGNDMARNWPGATFDKFIEVFRAVYTNRHVLPPNLREAWKVLKPSPQCPKVLVYDAQKVVNFVYYIFAFTLCGAFPDKSKTKGGGDTRPISIIKMQPYEIPQQIQQHRIKGGDSKRALEAFQRLVDRWVAEKKEFHLRDWPLANWPSSWDRFQLAISGCVPPPHVIHNQLLNHFYYLFEAQQTARREVQHLPELEFGYAVDELTWAEAHDGPVPTTVEEFKNWCHKLVLRFDTGIPYNVALPRTD